MLPVARSFLAVLLSYTLGLMLACTVSVGATDQAHRDRLLDVAFPHVHLGGQVVPLASDSSRTQLVYADHAQGASAWPGTGAVGAAALGGEALAANTSGPTLIAPAPRWFVSQLDRPAGLFAPPPLEPPPYAA